MAVDSATEEFRKDVIAGLSAAQKRIPSKYFYDARGSWLFDEICHLEEYYPTRTELSILRQYAGEIATAVGEVHTVIELGSGRSVKTEILLEHVRAKSYMPIDISCAELEASADRLQKRYPHLTVTPICADYSEELDLFECRIEDKRCLIFFPGSTIGNLTPEESREFLRTWRMRIGSNAQLLIGVDRKKDPEILHRAYNDCDGVTALFNLNLIDRINSELKPTTPLHSFEHEAFYNEAVGRIEMHLVCAEQQTLVLGDVRIPIMAGERILTEYSYKYTNAEFISLCADSGWIVKHSWTDAREWFSVHLAS